MKQHYVPEAYLRQWCGEDGHLVRYWRVGSQDAPRLRWDRKTPKGVCWENDLYALPAGGAANGLVDDGLEFLLARNVDQAIQHVVTTVGHRSGRLGPDLSDQVKWLMQTFFARSPSAISAVEADMASWAVEHAAMLQTLLQRALTPGIRNEVHSYLSPQMPPIAARAGLAAIAAAPQVPTQGWWDGAVHVLQATNLMPMLHLLGLDHFPTFDEPVVQWEPTEAGLTASFALSPTALALVIAEGVQGGWELALRHLVAALSHRQFAIYRSEVVAGPWLAEAQKLNRWARPAQRG